MSAVNRASAGSAFFLAVLGISSAASGGIVNYVIHVSMDGLRPDAITNLGAGNLPNFYRIRAQGAFTDNARADYDITVTLPNHVTQLTSRGIMGPAGHNWTSNSDPAPGVTLHTNKGAYVSGVFDVAHDNALRTGAFAGKTKFSLFDVRWNAVNGAPDLTGPDNGRDKIDTYAYSSNSITLTNTLASTMNTNPFNYAFLHLADPDATGHASGWDPLPGSAYSNTVKAMDARLGVLFGAIDGDARLSGHTAVILTADHGGSGTDHSDASLLEDYRVPFYVWGPGVTSGADLYGLNSGWRADPGVGRPQYSDPNQPIRNGEAANLALDLLGLGSVPGSSINSSQDLLVPEPATMEMLLLASLGITRRRRA